MRRKIRQNTDITNSNAGLNRIPSAAEKVDALPYPDLTLVGAWRVGQCIEHNVLPLDKRVAAPLIRIISEKPDLLRRCIREFGKSRIVRKRVMQCLSPAGLALCKVIAWRNLTFDAAPQPDHKRGRK
jgi:hypothetical protein